ncbi:MAG: trypsin-like peptidase domain-containing protein [Gemmatimonadota bacterium]|nr:trypsin-like peptidase domain-containing protein [Gemmatimonadota bacterium]
MSSRSRDWLKFGGLLGLALVAAAVFIGVLGSPTRAAEPAPFAMAEPVAASAADAIPAAQQSTVPAAAAPLAALGDAFAAVADQIIPVVVFIQSESYSTDSPHSGMQIPPGMEEFFFPRGQPRTPQRRRGTGSGFIISADGYIMTNNHVVEGADKVTVRLRDKRQFEAKVVGRDPQTDVAVIKIDAANLPSANLGNSDDLRIGEWVLAIGNPLGEAFSFTVTAGIVSAKGRMLGGLPNRTTYSIMDFIQTDAAINPGNSGGPLVNIRGEVVGVNSAIASENGFYQGYGFAIPANLARVVGNQLIAEGRVHRSILGVAIADANEEDAAYAGFDEVRGVVVNDYSMTDSPAEKAGIQPGDLIVELDGEPVSYVAQLQQLVGFKKPGSTVKVTVVRKGGERKTLNVRLIEAPAEELAQVASREDDQPREEPAGTGKALGISVRQPPAEVATQLGPDRVGPLVVDVDVGSPAQDRLSAARGDIITHVNGTRVRTAGEFERAVRGLKPGEIVSLRIVSAAVGGQSSMVRLRVPR